MSNLIEKQIKREEIYDGAVLHVVKDTVELPNGNESIREFCLHVRFSKSLMHRQITEAHGCFIVSNFIIH